MNSRQTGSGARMSAPAREAGVAGFTLIELLVAITLFAVMTGILAGGLRFGTRVWERADTVGAQVSDIETAFAIVRRLVSGALPLATTTPDGEPTMHFQGDINAVSFIGPAPVQAFVGGLHQITLARVHGSTGEKLVLQVSDFAPVPAGPRARRSPAAAAAAKTVVLIDGAAAIDFSYYGPGEDTLDRSWQTTWINRTLLPVLVAVRIRFPETDGRVWPDLIVAPEVREAAY